tara:strand:- start:218040 stop:218420 length:381 start_codon:yes stop_codon:yes gene_type:complete
MNPNYTTLAVFEYSTEAQLVKSKLLSEDIRVMLTDEVTIDTDPLLSQAIGGVKLQVYNDDLERATAVYNEIRAYQKDTNGNDIYCINCNATRILIAPPSETNVFYKLFPFFEKKKYRCNECKTEFK